MEGRQETRIIANRKLCVCRYWRFRHSCIHSLSLRMSVESIPPLHHHQCHLTVSLSSTTGFPTHIILRQIHDNRRQNGRQRLVMLLPLIHIRTDIVLANFDLPSRSSGNFLLIARIPWSIPSITTSRLPVTVINLISSSSGVPTVRIAAVVSVVTTAVAFRAVASVSPTVVLAQRLVAVVIAVAAGLMAV